MDEAREKLLNIRFNSFAQAVDTHPSRYNIDEKPTLDDLIERARKIEAYIIEG